MATLVPRPWLTPSLARVDAEYEHGADHLATDSAKEAERFLYRLADGIDPAWLTPKRERSAVIASAAEPGAAGHRH